MNKSNKSFGSFIREIRISNDIGQRELAEKIGISASYLNDIEKEKRTAPKTSVIKKLSILLETNNDDLNDLAAISKKSVAPDIGEFIESNPKIISLIRTIKDNNLNDNQIAYLAKEANETLTSRLKKILTGEKLAIFNKNLPKDNSK